jgi:hypothetical protein
MEVKKIPIKENRCNKKRYLDDLTDEEWGFYIEAHS